MNGKLNIWFLLLVIIFSFEACRSHKRAITSETSPETTFYHSCFPIESITVSRYKLDITEGNNSYQLNGSLYIQADSVCYFRGTVLIEVVRGVIYRDSFVILNRLERICYKGSNDFLYRLTGYPVNPQTLLLLFTADRCRNTYEELGFRMTRKNDKILMQGKNTVPVEMSIDKDDLVESLSMNSQYPTPVRFNMTYDRYRNFQQFTLPTFFDISSQTGKNNMKLNIDFQDIVFNQPHKVNFTVPGNYKIVWLE